MIQTKTREPLSPTERCGGRVFAQGGGTPPAGVCENCGGVDRRAVSVRRLYGGVARSSAKVQELEDKVLALSDYLDSLGRGAGEERLKLATLKLEQENAIAELAQLSDSFKAAMTEGEHQYDELLRGIDKVASINDTRGSRLASVELVVGSYEELRRLGGSLAACIVELDVKLEELRHGAKRARARRPK